MSCAVPAKWSAPSTRLKIRSPLSSRITASPARLYAMVAILALLTVPPSIRATELCDAAELNNAGANEVHDEVFVCPAAVSLISPGPLDFLVIEGRLFSEPPNSELFDPILRLQQQSAADGNASDLALERVSIRNGADESHTIWHRLDPDMKTAVLIYARAGAGETLSISIRDDQGFDVYFEIESETAEIETGVYADDGGWVRINVLERLSSGALSIDFDFERLSSGGALRGRLRVNLRTIDTGSPFLGLAQFEVESTIPARIESHFLQLELGQPFGSFSGISFSDLPAVSLERARELIAADRETLRNSASTSEPTADGHDAALAVVRSDGSAQGANKESPPQRPTNPLFSRGGGGSTFVGASPPSPPKTQSERSDEIDHPEAEPSTRNGPKPIQERDTGSFADSANPKTHGSISSDRKRLSAIMDRAENVQDALLPEKAMKSRRDVFEPIRSSQFDRGGPESQEGLMAIVLKPVVTPASSDRSSDIGWIRHVLADLRQFISEAIDWWNGGKR